MLLLAEVPLPPIQRSGWFRPPSSFSAVTGDVSFSFVVLAEQFGNMQRWIGTFSFSVFLSAIRAFPVTLTSSWSWSCRLLWSCSPLSAASCSNCGYAFVKVGCGGVVVGVAASIVEIHGGLRLRSFPSTFCTGRCVPRSSSIGCS